MLSGGAEDVGRGAGRRQRKLPGREPSPASPQTPEAGVCSGRGVLSEHTALGARKQHKSGERQTCAKAPGFARDRMDPPNTGKGFRQLLSLHYQ